MPTWEQSISFRQDLKNLTPEQKRAFKRAVEKFVVDLRAGKFRQGLRIEKVAGRESVWEMTWAPDGRATFQYGDEVNPGEPHVIWRRVGTHDIYGRP